MTVCRTKRGAPGQEKYNTSSIYTVKSSVEITTEISDFKSLRCQIASGLDLKSLAICASKLRCKVSLMFLHHIMFYRDCYQLRPQPGFKSEKSRRLWRFPGSVRGFRGKLQESPGKISGKNVPESRNATNSKISGTGKGKPAANVDTARTLSPPSVRGDFRNRQFQLSRVFLIQAPKSHIVPYATPGESAHF